MTSVSCINVRKVSVSSLHMMSSSDMSQFFSGWLGHMLHVCQDSFAKCLHVSWFLHKLHMKTEDGIALTVLLLDIYSLEQHTWINPPMRRVPDKCTLCSYLLCDQLF